ncbi:transglutaminase family protein [Zavarzinella formosa]|uniref:transglutaminase family protein n=1 Tax=Zavarzinella formosa TaxID=360055 RepID=UPI000313037D|nr:transglutaminase family protein [Zavarzinella formosa]
MRLCVLALAIPFLFASPIVAQEPKAKTVEEIAEQLKPSICVITSRGREAKRENLGTGFVVSADGLIATNAHVIGEGRPISVEFADGRKFDATAIHAHDTKRDMAIIKIDAKDLKPIPLGDSDALKDGQGVLALGNPKGLKHSVVSGVVSGKREIEGRKMIQIAIPVEPGNSGGPLVDLFGRVQGIITLKSLVTDNLGFAGSVNELKPLLKKPNTVPMAAWVTIGALDPEDWKVELGSQWTQRAGRLRVEGAGNGFGGRSYCVYQRETPKVPFEVTVTVKLEDERGAAGLIFRHDGERHYGFYPTGGKLRFTRFDGPDVYSWKILHDAASVSYKPEEWNTLRVRVEKTKTLCYLNDQLVLESDDVAGEGTSVGLAKFRDTKAEFKNFRVGASLASTPEDSKEILKLLGDFKTGDPQKTLGQLAAKKSSTDVIRERAKELERQAAELKFLASRVQERRVYDELMAVLKQPEEKTDLIHAALLLAKLDNEDVDVKSYRDEVDRMAGKIKALLPKDADDSAKLKTLNKFFFDVRGYHGSRGDYYTRSNSYLNEVMDDREGLPITLCVIYMELARRIDVPVAGIGLPGHFVARHMPAKGEGKFIDVYERGEFMTEEEAKKKVGGIDISDEFLKPVTKKLIVSRMLHNLLRVAQNDQDVDGGLRYLNGILMLDPEAGQSRMMRAGMYLSKGMKKEAIADVDYLIEHPPGDVDPRRLNQIRRQLDE